MLWLVGFSRQNIFQGGCFLEAEVGHNPSFIWRSIWSSQILLKSGMQWRIGDGSSIRVWGDSWLRDNMRPMLETPIIACRNGMKVNELFILGRKEWDMQRLSSLFTQDVEEIMCIPLLGLNGDDQQLWRFTKDGCYSVKSGHRRCYDIAYGSTEGCQYLYVCVHCENDVENAWHLFFTCPFSKSCW